MFWATTAKQYYRFSLSLILATALASCTQDPVIVHTLSSEKKINSFVIRTYNNLGLSADANGVISNDTIRFTLTDGYPLFYIFPTISFSGKHISPAETVSQNFSNPVTYTVTAEDGTTMHYIVLGKSMLNSNSKDIVSFSFRAADNPLLSTDSKGSIGKDSILVKLPAGTNTARLVPFILINGTSISPDNLNAQDFSHSVMYKVFAEDGSSKNYLVIAGN